MTATLRTELRKALTNKMLYIAIMFGIVICGMDVFDNALKIQEFDQRISDALAYGGTGRTSHTGYSLFYLWMGMTPMTQGSNWFCLIWPVLAAMAYGWSYADERRSGLFNQIASRGNPRRYYIAKYAAVFISGGLAVAIPVLLNLLVNALVCPFDYISPSFGLVQNINFMSALFYQNPWGYGLLWCGMTFLCGGIAACLCFIAGTKLRYGFMTILVPYGIYLLLDSLILSLRKSVLADVSLELSPLKLISAVPGFNNPEWLVFSILGGLTLLSFGIGYWQVVKHELV